MTPHTQAAFVTSFVDREGRQPTPQEVWDAAIRSYRDLAQPASVPAGWKLVPPEATLAMLDAYSRVWAVGSELDGSMVWVAMLAAAPQAPQPAQADNKWRELALKFDGQRMAALAHLRTLLAHPAEHAEAVRKFLAEPPQAAPQPAQAALQLTGCNCRWDGETQVRWCELHLAHKEAIHDWAARAKTAEAKLAAPQPEAQPHSLVSDREYLRIFEAARHGSSAPVGTLRGIRACIAAYEAAAPSAQAPQPEAQPQWQPIETAPKDGRTLLLGHFNAAGKWRTVRGQWMSADYIAEYWEEPDEHEPGWFETVVADIDVPNCWSTEPTHWMPLPAAPSAQAEPQKPNYRAECWPESPHNKQAEQGGE